MRIGYPCVNLGIGCTSARTFRLRSYSAALLAQKVASNLDCLTRTLEWNAARGILFYRITSDLVPFASHPVCRCDWGRRFADRFVRIGALIRACGMRVSMHPDQFTLINSPDRGIFVRSVRELRYHAAVLDAMGLGAEAKIQIHAGGVYGERTAAMRRFIARYDELTEAVRRRLVVENDERCYPLADCLALHRTTGIPVVCDVFHHRILNRGETVPEALRLAGRTWGREDGPPIVDYSAQAPGKRIGTHVASIPLAAFKRFLAAGRPLDFDLMLEIKDKERSALRALRAARGDRRLS